MSAQTLTLYYEKESKNLVVTCRVFPLILQFSPFDKIHFPNYHGFRRNLPQAPSYHILKIPRCTTIRFILVSSGFGLTYSQGALSDQILSSKWICVFQSDELCCVVIASCNFLKLGVKKCPQTDFLPFKILPISENHQFYTISIEIHANSYYHEKREKNKWITATVNQELKRNYSRHFKTRH